MEFLFLISLQVSVPDEATNRRNCARDLLNDSACRSHILNLVMYIAYDQIFEKMRLSPPDELTEHFWWEAV